jgi:hypothetical protein
MLRLLGQCLIPQCRLFAGGRLKLLYPLIEGSQLRAQQFNLYQLFADELKNLVALHR